VRRGVVATSTLRMLRALLILRRLLPLCPLIRDAGGFIASLWNKAWRASEPIELFPMPKNLSQRPHSRSHHIMDAISVHTT
jgi:hypothetical protein